MECLYCRQKFSENLSYQFIFSLRAIKSWRICDKCQYLPKQIDLQHVCSGCCRPNKTDQYCEDCKKWLAIYPKSFITHHALFEYDKFAKDFMKSFKFEGDLYLAHFFEETLAPYLKKKFRDWVIIPIPISDKQKKNRGFNQVEVLLDYAGISYRNILDNISSGQKQSEKTKKERLETAQPFSRKKEFSHEKFDHVLIVDDIYTTGRTILYAKELFHETKNISSFSLFR